MQRLSLLFFSIILASAPPLAAQEAASGRLPPGCKRERVKEPKPPRPEVARSDSIRTAIRNGVLEDVRAAAREAGITEPAGLLLVTVDRNREGGEVRLARGNVPESVIAAVAERSLRRFREWPDRETIRLPLRLDTLAVPEAPVGSVRVECTPLLENRELIRTQLDWFAQSASFPRTGGSFKRTARLVLFVSRDGEVVHADLDRRSGLPGFDDFVLRLAPQLRFRPASLDGVPVDVMVTMPISLQPPSRRR